MRSGHLAFRTLPSRFALASVRALGASDGDGDELTFQWLLTSLPAGSAATLSDPMSVNPTFFADVSGAYVAELIVTDAEFDSDPDSVKISTENSAPVADAGLRERVERGMLDEQEHESLVSDYRARLRRYTYLD